MTRREEIVLTEILDAIALARAAIDGSTSVAEFERDRVGRAAAERAL